LILRPWTGRWGPRPGKYHAQAVTVDGIRFDSTREATRYRELRLLVAAGEITGLEQQPEFPLLVMERWRGGPPWIERYCGRYRADFRYVLPTGEIVIEDVKSAPTKTTAYRLRKRIVEAIHGVTIREV